ncbi:MAG: carboxymuconolactone decarboxylase family protein [Candidatus Dadabacteria bacterium]|nr:carboxymuconolactone decarboxylase family protein [Candidatus Dadabacteria bacterium]MCH8329735.1 carboxymuconolactone decarboxylase family protein [Nanoarchaeota archaeon]TDI80645.1 MAG: carboxymuconolactone decarboxylase family protein [Bacteroidota bacterium]
MAKIAYVERDQVPENIQGMYDGLQKKFGVVPNVIKAMANAPELLAGFMPFLGAALGPSKVSSDLKELAILTTSKLNGCAYCTAHHTAAGKKAGLTDEKIAASDDPTSAALDDKEKAIVQYTTELAKNVAASDEALSEMRKHFNDGEIAELTMVAGTFHVLTRFADTFKIDLEHG